jgi:hypothetical protein
MHLLEDVTYWSERRDVGTAVSIDQPYGGAAAEAIGTGEFSDLNAQGCLPQNRAGDLTAVIVQHSSNHADDSTALSNAVRLHDAGVFLELLLKGLLEVSINNVLVVRGSPIHFGGNFPYYFGGAATNLLAGLGNVGMLRFLSHQLAPNDQFSARLRTRIDIADDGSGGFVAASKFIDLTYQVQTMRKVQ